MIVADTNVVSEFMKDHPDESVMAWARTLASADLTICVVTVEEIERGIGRLPRGRRASDLQARWRRLLEDFEPQIAVYDVAAAQNAAAILVRAEAAGRPMGLADAQIAGICAAHGYALATRNLQDFASAANLKLINPFTMGASDPA